MSPAPMLFATYPLWFNVTTVVVFVIAAAYLVAQLVVRAVRLAARALVGHDFERDPRGRALAAPLRLVRAIVFLLVAAVLVFPALKIAGVETSVGLRPEALVRWLLESGLRIALVVLVSWLLLRIIGMIVLRFEQQVGEAGSADAIERAKRARTLGTLVQNTAGVLVVGIALLMILRELHLDITPILTGAGIAGLAVGFGAQSLVKDVISGFFLILENQVRVGDAAAINGTSGLVEATTLRTIVLRDAAGTVHVFPNGSITTLSNMSKDFSYYVIDLGLSYDEDTDRATAIIKEVGAALKANPTYSPLILEPIEILGVDAFTDSQVILKLRIKTLPQKQWDVGRELRRRIKIRFDEEGIVLTTRAVMLRVTRTEDHAEAALKASSVEPPTPAS